VFNFVHFASTLSVRKDFKVGGNLDISQKEKMPSVNYYLEYASLDDSNSLKYIYKDKMSLSMTYMGGTLHGMWNMDYDGSGMFQYSDRRLKENIRPLFKTLAASTRGPDAREDSQEMDDKASRDTGNQRSWNDILQQLRPVSYDLRSDPGKERFGFIADEMEQVLPQVTRTQPKEDGRMGIIYEDLIAVLVNAMQDLFSDMTQLRPRLDSVERRIQDRKAWRMQRRQMLGPAR